MFLNKEGKWFSNVKGNMIDANNSNLDTKEFSVQGIGFAQTDFVAEPPPRYVSFFASPSYVQEGSAVTIILKTENVPDGTYFTFDLTSGMSQPSPLIYNNTYTNPSDSNSFAIEKYNWAITTNDIYSISLNEVDSEWDESNGELYGSGTANGVLGNLHASFGGPNNRRFANARGRIFNNYWSRTFTFNTDCVDGTFHDTNTAGQPEPFLTNTDGSQFIPFDGNGVYNQTLGGYEINYNELRIALDNSDESGNSTLDYFNNKLSLSVKVYKIETPPEPLIESNLTVTDIGDNAPID